ncbi:hypothetical protein K438DRAFT_1752920 [Mycena galopus ATCC 62051]|nr:hypothetical protein K438DRAFT_1752920 [Mycena galopus ATCC 62051]
MPRRKRESKLFWGAVVPLGTVFQIVVGPVEPKALSIFRTTSLSGGIASVLRLDIESVEQGQDITTGVCQFANIPGGACEYAGPSGTLRDVVVPKAGCSHACIDEEPSKSHGSGQRVEITALMTQRQRGITMSVFYFDLTTANQIEKSHKTTPSVR